MKPNTVILGWPYGWRKSEQNRTWRAFLETCRVCAASRTALVIPKGINFFPDSTEKVWVLLSASTCYNQRFPIRCLWDYLRILYAYSFLTHLTHIAYRCGFYNNWFSLFHALKSLGYFLFAYDDAILVSTLSHMCQLAVATAVIECINILNGDNVVSYGNTKCMAHNTHVYRLRAISISGGSFTTAAYWC